MAREQEKRSARRAAKKERTLSITVPEARTLRRCYMGDGHLLKPGELDAISDKLDAFLDTEEESE